MVKGTVDAQCIHEALGTLESVPPLPPFSSETLAFCTGFSRRLRRSFRGSAEAQALAYWMRPSEITRLHEQFEALGTKRTMLVPRGTAFHIPPSNVDSIFVYSWMLSMLVGNKNILRVSSRINSAAETLIGLAQELLAEYPAIEARTLIVRYGRELEVTTAISRTCDVRLIWGGDTTIQTIRQSPLPVHAIECTFPDRFSFGVLNVASYLRSDTAARKILAERFYNDAYMFDQLACSSPKLIVWVGGTADEFDQASDVFFRELTEVVVERGYAVDPGGSIAKLEYSYRAMLDLDVASVKRIAPQITMLDLATFPTTANGFCGGGVFMRIHVDSLTDLLPRMRRWHQTVTYFGFEPDEMKAFARACNGAGGDRIVPIGEALTFNRYWDGFDLLQSLSRRVYVESVHERDSSKV